MYIAYITLCTADPTSHPFLHKKKKEKEARKRGKTI
jgi:hypothetical protein